MINESAIAVRAVARMRVSMGTVLLGSEVRELLEYPPGRKKVARGSAASQRTVSLHTKPS